MMKQGTVLRQHRERTARSCRHHWIIESPHGATSRGVCKRCGVTRRFPNAAEDARWQSDRFHLGRWAGHRGATRPREISLQGKSDRKV